MAASRPGGFPTRSSASIRCRSPRPARSTKCNCGRNMVRCRREDAAAPVPRASKGKVNLASKAKPQTKRTSKAEQRAETLEQILDTAEHRFSKTGFYGVKTGRAPCRQRVYQ